MQARTQIDHDMVLTRGSQTFLALGRRILPRYPLNPRNTLEHIFTTFKMLEYTRTVVHVKDPQIDPMDINISMLI